MNTAPQNNASMHDWAQLLFLSFVWGGAFMAMAVALEQYGPFTVAAGRMGIGALALLAVVVVSRPADLLIRDPKLLTFILVLGVLNFAMPFSLLTWGIQQVPSAFAGVAMGSSPLLVLVLAHLFVPDEQIGPRRIAGVILGFVGLLVLILPGAAGDSSGGTFAARMACVGAALCYSVGGILIRRAPPIPSMVFTAGMLTAGTLVLTPLALLAEGLPQITGAQATWAILYAGLLPTGLAFLLRVVLIRSAGPIFMSLVAYIVPLWAVLLGVVLLGETLRLSTYIGAVIILSGVGLTQVRFLRKG